MKVIALRNFHCNKVHAHIGKELSEAELVKIGKLLEHLESDGQVKIEHEPAPVDPDPSDEPVEGEAPKGKKKLKKGD